MNSRQSVPWAWILGTLALVLVVGVLAYWLGASRGVLFGRLSNFGGGFGFGVFHLVGFALVVALLVGVVVAALTREPTATTETYAEWHRRAHAIDSTPDATAPIASSVEDETSGAAAPSAVSPSDDEAPG